ncbi:MAG: hypothetical protein SPK23_08165 [Eubacteriales bacterium]|nr:hypothetical protein [Clostridiales bacterium]MDY5837065.1 hypothetical protein [Eubacteriales bacterium]
MSEELVALIKDYSVKFRAWQDLLSQERIVRADIITDADEKGEEPENLRDLLEEKVENSGLREQQMATLTDLKEAERKLFAFNFEHCEDPVLLSELEHLAQDYAARITWLQQFLDVYDKMLEEAAKAESPKAKEKPAKAKSTATKAKATQAKAEAEPKTKAKTSAEAKPAATKSKTTSTKTKAEPKPEPKTKAKAPAKSSASKTKSTAAKTKTESKAKAKAPAKAKPATSKTKATSTKAKPATSKTSKTSQAKEA